MIRELTVNEVEDVSGSLGPLLAAAYALGTNTAVRSFGSYALSRAFSAYAVYSAARHYGGGGSYS